MYGVALRITPEQLQAEVDATLPLGRMAHPQDVADATIELIGEWMSGLWQAPASPPEVAGSAAVSYSSKISPTTSSMRSSNARSRIWVPGHGHASAFGLDVDRISHVVNYECPDSESTYVHRIGRTGRAGKTGIAVTFVDWDDLHR